MYMRCAHTAHAAGACPSLERRTIPPPPLALLYPLPPLSLQGRRGVWVVEVRGGGRTCRALVRKGGLMALPRPSPAGLALTLFREDGAPVPDPRWAAGFRVRVLGFTCFLHVWGSGL